MPNTPRFGPHSASVERLLDWIECSELLQFKGTLIGPFNSVPNLPIALAMMRTTVNWTELREQQEASLYEPGLLDSTQWQSVKLEIEQLQFYVADRIEAHLPAEFRSIIDDVIADLASCALCLAVHGEFNRFHDLLWKAYACGGWPCGCNKEWPPDDQRIPDDMRFYVLWNSS